MSRRAISGTRRSFGFVTGASRRSRRVALKMAAAIGVACTAFWIPAAAVPPQPRAGEPLADLSSTQHLRFHLGLEAYETPLSTALGLGPAFNQTSCAACHETPLGGWGATPVTRFGNISGGAFDFLESLGGPVLQRFAISPACVEVLPPPEISNHVRERVTPSVLAFGLVEAIPDEAILALADPDDSDGDGISGRAHLVVPLENPTGPLRVGRFGWKAQVATVRTFSADAARNEMGLTNALLPEETAPGGDSALLDDCDDVPDVEDQPDAFGATFVDRVTDFQRYLAPPPQSPRSGMAGEAIFNAIGCVKCHVREFTTSDSLLLEPVLRERTIRPYGDFLLHDMGGLADGIPEGDALPNEMRTPPLWNLRTRPVLLHDGSANSPLFEVRVEEAILAHAGEGLTARNAYAGLSEAEKAQVMAFLDSLGRDDYDVDGDGLLTMLDYAIVVASAGDADVTPDEPWAVADLDQNGLIDGDEIDGLREILGIPADCNQNGVPDWSEIVSGTTDDENANGLPDECDQSSCTAQVKRVAGSGGAIPDAGGGSLVRTLSVTPPDGNPAIESIRVTLDLEHTWASDLTITLRRGTDAPVTLHSGCGAFHDLDGRYHLVDTAWEGSPSPLLRICEGTLLDNGEPDEEERFTFTPGTYRPAQGSASTGFQTLRGQSMGAAWTLTITDNRPNDVGTLLGWTIDFRYADPAPLDCDGVGGPDCAQIVADPSLDCDHDGVIDSCQSLSGDCDGDGVRDRCQLFEGTAFDCSDNGVLDACEIAAGAVRDCNLNGVPDSCEVADGEEEDVDADSILDGCERAFGDLDLDGQIGPADLAMLLGVWGTVPPPFGDFDGDGLVSGSDLAQLLVNWDAVPPWAVPTIASVTPNQGSTAGGTPITVVGSHFAGVTTLSIGGAAATSVVVVNSTTVTAVTPAGSAGSQTVSLTTAGGTAQLADGFSYVALPTMASVLPSGGPITGGTPITIVGTNLSGTTAVSIGGAAATSVVVVNSTTVTAVTPPGTPGAAEVSLATPGGTATLPAGYTYAVCDDGDPCTTDSVVDGTCVHVPIDCDDGDPCTVDTCEGGVCVHVPVDADGDGYAPVSCGGGDCDDGNPEVHPGMTEVCGNGIDDDCNGLVDCDDPACKGDASCDTLDWATVLEVAPDPAVITDSEWRERIIATGLPWRVQDNASGIEMLLVPPGTFMMGCSPSQSYGCDSDEYPVHEVTLTQPFYLGRYEVTQAQWTAVMGSNPSNFQSASAQVPAEQVPNRPVEQVSWNMIQGFEAETGLRLPTEAEWEYACRAGTQTAFNPPPNGTNADYQLGQLAWHFSNAASQTRPVGQKLANNLGLHDMHGNVSEWVEDWFSSIYYSVGPPVDPSGPLSGTVRVLRGGSWYSSSRDSRASDRATYSSGSDNIGIGFRVARTPAAPACLGGCDDGDPCTVDTCEQGVCVHTPLDCDDPVCKASPSCDPLNWATVLETTPDPTVITSAEWRARIVATGLPWRVQDNSSGIEMLLVPPGTFNMGCSPSQSYGCNSSENPVHEVTLTQPFYLGRYEVTQAQWTAVMASNPSNFQSPSEQVPASQVPNRPVERVSWNMIQIFEAVTGLRLPTEAEWEYGCRAGANTAFNNGSNDDSTLGTLAWTSSNSGIQTRPVGQKQANNLGLHDMHGNVWEWVEDWYGSGYYAQSPAVDPPGPASGSYRGLRGGSLNNNSSVARASYRSGSVPEDDSTIYGFRVARTP